MNDPRAHAPTTTETQSDSHCDSKSPCKSTKRDGSPCQGRGLEQFDGYCIAHAPPHLTRAWRAKGGKNSSTAARQDKRIPEHQKELITELTKGFHQVHAGTLAASDYTAMCRGVSTLLQLHSRVEKDMEVIRAEETQTAAQEVVGVHGDIEILTAAADINDQLNQYRFQGLVDQGLATLKESSDANKPPVAVLTAEGRRRFGERRRTSYQQEDIDEIRDAVRSDENDQEEHLEFIEELEYMGEAYDATLADLTLQPDPPKDPFTGEPVSELPSGLHRREPSDLPPLHDDRSPETLAEQRDQVEAICLEALDKNLDENYETGRVFYHYDQDGDSATYTANRQPPTVDHSQVPTKRY